MELPHLDPGLRTLTSAPRIRFKQGTADKWESDWKASKHGWTSFKLCEAPTKRNLDKFKNLERPQASVLVQFRTGKISLASYQHRIRKADSKFCSCSEVENVQHVLLQCPMWTELRKEVYWKRFNTNIKKLLGSLTKSRTWNSAVHPSHPVDGWRGTELDKGLDHNDSEARI